MKQVLYAGDAVLVGETREHLQHMIERAFEGMGLKINVGKSKVLTIKKGERGSCERVRVNGEEMQRRTSLITWE